MNIVIVTFKNIFVSLKLFLYKGPKACKSLQLHKRICPSLLFRWTNADLLASLLLSPSFFCHFRSSSFSIENLNELFGHWFVLEFEAFWRFLLDLLLLDRKISCLCASGLEYLCSFLRVNFSFSFCFWFLVYVFDFGIAWENIADFYFFLFMLIFLGIFRWSIGARFNTRARKWVSWKGDM